ncbi:MAG: phosphatase PAP2 family protein [Bacteroidia bacterium]
MKKTIWYFFLTFSVLRLYGQVDSLPVPKIYHVNRLTVSILIVGVSVANVLSVKPLRDKPVIAETEFNSLNPEALNSFDSWALKQNPADRKKFQQISNYSQIPYFLIPEVMFAINKKMRKDWLDISLMYWEGHTITFFSYNYGFLGPRFQNSYRPVVYYDEIPIEDRNIGYNRSSFYSGHVASVAYTSFFTAKVYSDYHPELGIKKYLLFAAALVPPAAMSYLRVKALDHFPSHCMAGLLIGASVGIAVPEFHKFHNKDISIGMFSSPTGTGLTMRWKFS